jgi:hypothetical protein
MVFACSWDGETESACRILVAKHVGINILNL